MCSKKAAGVNVLPYSNSGANGRVSGCGSNCNMWLGWKVTLIIMYINGCMGVSVGVSVGVAVGVAVSVGVPKALLWGFTRGSGSRRY